MDKETVMSSLVSILNTPDLADLVSRKFLTNKDIPASVKRAIMAVDEEGENELDYVAGGYADIDFTVNLVCYIRSEKNLHSEINDFDKKIKARLGSNKKLNNTAFSSQIRPLTEKEIKGSACLFVRPLRIQYEGVVTDGL
jgi:hypothetical protein